MSTDQGNFSKHNLLFIIHCLKFITIIQKKNYKKKLKPDLNNNITPSVFKQVLNQSKERR